MAVSPEPFLQLLGCAEGVPEGSFVVICDTLQCPGSFLVPLLLSSHLSASPPTCAPAAGAGPGAGLSLAASGGSADGRGAGQASGGCQGMVCLVALAQPPAHYLAIARKMGVPVTQMQQGGQLALLDALHLGLHPSPAPSPSEPSPPWGSASLLPLFASVAQVVRGPSSPAEVREGGAAVGQMGQVLGPAPLGNPPAAAQHSQAQAQAGEGGCRQEASRGLGTEGAEGSTGCPLRPCVVVDDAWLLEVAAAGSTRGGALDFLHYCRTLRRHFHRCSVVALVHADEPWAMGAGPDEATQLLHHNNPLLPALLSSCDVSLHVRPLPSGYAADLHGAVDVVHRTGKLLPAQSNSGRWHNSSRMFQIHEKSVNFFE